MKNYSSLFSQFIKGHGEQIHFRAHSHHFWPDVTKDAVLEYFEDSATLSDDKWEKIFCEKIPQAQKLIADTFNFSKPSNIVFAQNTHELFFRLFSSLMNKNKKIKILTTDGEFLSFDRQAKRLLEDHWIKLEIISTAPFNTLVSRLIDAGVKNVPDIVFVSQVFFNSAVALTQKEIEDLSFAFKGKSLFVLDGYHGFMALPLDLSKIQNDLFYLAGSYKYLGAGEGCCFMTIPEGCKLRPLNTGWFADLAHLDSGESKVFYPNDGLRFAGSTMDFSALYKVCKILELYKAQGISVSAIHQHIQTLQKYFLKECLRLNHHEINEGNLLYRDLNHHGHFFTFKVKSLDRAKEIARALKKNKVLVDTRGDRVRFGFALYQNVNYQLDFSGV